MTLPANCLWMGELEPYMDETFIVKAFDHVGITVVNVKMHTAKNGMRYAILEFNDNFTSVKCLRKWNGVIVPGSNPLVTFKLNWTAHGKPFNAIAEYTAFVGNLTPDVTDENLLHFFYQRYLSLKSAKIILNSEGKSQGYGFLKFADENECSRAILEMNGVTGLGFRPICCGHSVPDLVQKAKSFLYAYIPLASQTGSDGCWNNNIYQNFAANYTLSSDGCTAIVSSIPTAMAHTLCTTTYALNNSSHLASQALPVSIVSKESSENAVIGDTTLEHSIYNHNSHPPLLINTQLSTEDKRRMASIGDPETLNKTQFFQQFLKGKDEELKEKFELKPYYVKSKFLEPKFCCHYDHLSMFTARIRSADETERKHPIYLSKILDTTLIL